MIAGARAHHQPLERRESHRRVHRCAAADGRRRAAAAEVEHDQLQIGDRPTQQRGGAGRGPRVGDAVEAETADAVALGQLPGDGVAGRALRQPPRGTRCRRRPPSGSRRQGWPGTSGYRPGSDGCAAAPAISNASIASMTASSMRAGRREAWAAVHDAMADGLDRAGAARQLERVLHGRGMIAIAHGLGPLGQRPAGGGGGARLDRHQAELHRRRPAVQREHVHRPIPPRTGAISGQRRSRIACTETMRPSRRLR